jgi:hypothetical protein
VVSKYDTGGDTTRSISPYSKEELKQRRKAIRERHRRMLEENLARLGIPLLAHQDYCRLRDLDEFLLDRYGDMAKTTRTSTLSIYSSSSANVKPGPGLRSIAHG